MDDPLRWLMHWFDLQSDGEWERQYGIKLETVGNPGWYLTIDLAETLLEDRPFEAVDHNLESDIRWWTCQVKERQFRAACGPHDLPAVIGVFRTWADREAAAVRRSG